MSNLNSQDREREGGSERRLQSIRDEKENDDKEFELNSIVHVSIELT